VLRLGTEPLRTWRRNCLKASQGYIKFLSSESGLLERLKELLEDLRVEGWARLKFLFILFFILFLESTTALKGDPLSPLSIFLELIVVFGCLALFDYRERV
jgi:hypothetical protein